ncbi:hypothetical protein FJT64_024400 [Amphibalanus amphitrite]|uniref:Gustatory receptor n=1 Tax=Amphibalanus amphitrite TaxID=1232801 RepID=A0A6A4WJ56_AMPAM|nr:hypothetical protein FJT64_024400 [Amphibalanus amphitrite]
MTLVRIKTGRPATRSGQVTPAGRPPVQRRLLVALLRATASTTRSGWRSSLYAALVYCLTTTAALQVTVSLFKQGLGLRKAGAGYMTTMTHTYFFGMMPLIAWTSLTVTFVYGGRRYERVLTELDKMPDIPPELPKTTAAARWRNRLSHLDIWLLVIILPFTTLCGSAVAIVRQCHPFVPMCLLSIVVTVQRELFFMLPFLLVPAKFMWAARRLRSRSDAVNVALESLVNSRPSDAAARLELLGRAQSRISACLTRLTDGMAAELVPTMLYGVSALVVLIMRVTAKGAEDLVSLVLPYSCSAWVTLAGPCEASQQLVSAAGRRWALLLSLERRHPALAAEAGLQREEAGRQLETVGELGLFRLRRSTLLSLISTVLTYVIVMAQFLVSETPVDAVTANVTHSGDK